jgi:hypothetical protein
LLRTGTREVYHVAMIPHRKSIRYLHLRMSCLLPRKHINITCRVAMFKDTSGTSLRETKRVHDYAVSYAEILDVSVSGGTTLIIPLQRKLKNKLRIRLPPPPYQQYNIQFGAAQPQHFMHHVTQHTVTTALSRNVNRSRPPSHFQHHSIRSIQRW